MKKLTILALFVVLANYSFGKTPWEDGKLKVSENGRYLQHENGEPFFWLGDTFQMQHIRNLILSRPYFERVNDQSVVSGDEGDKYNRILVTRGNDYLMAYTYTGREFTIQMGKILGKMVNAWWYDTRTGEAYKIGEYENKGSIRFDPPGVKYNGNDWVLVLDNAAKMFGKPGV